MLMIWLILGIEYPIFLKFSEEGYFYVTFGLFYKINKFSGDIFNIKIRPGDNLKGMLPE